MLLYLVFKCRNSTKIDLTESIREVFDQHAEMDRSGNVTGGKGKLACLRHLYLGPRAVHSLTKTLCGNVIEGFRTLVDRFYLYVKAWDETDSDMGSFSETGSIQVSEARKKLGSSQWILDMINRHLASKWDVDDDGSLLKSEHRRDPSAETNHRKRKAPNDQDGPCLTFNALRKGRLLPSVSIPSGDVPALMRHLYGTSFT